MSNLSMSFFKNHPVKFLKYPFAFLVFVFCSFVGAAKTYYVSSSAGNDNYTATQAQNQSTPWRSVAKINSFVGSLSAGDQVLFKRGESFYGTLTPAASNVTFGAYGAGENPIITGLTTISSWSSVGANIWEADVPGGLSSLNTVIVNGIFTPMGRYPNLNTANGGYSTYESAVLNVSLTDNQLTSSPNWTGAEVVFRRTSYTTDRARITNHNGTTISFTTTPGVPMRPGFGYFIQNSPATLDQNGEWYYNPSNKKIRIFYIGTPPSIQVATLQNLISLPSPNNVIRTNTTIRDISFKGSNGNIAYFEWVNYLNIDNCDFLFGGINGIEYKWAKFFTVQNSTINDVNMNGILQYATNVTTNTTIKNNIIDRIGISPGMFSNLYDHSTTNTGIVMSSENLLIEQNTISNVGYIGISLSNKNNQTVRKNVISNYCSVNNDGGGIYSSGLRGGTIAKNLLIENNIVFNAIGAMGGSLSTVDKHARAIYLDATSYGVSVLNNTIFDAWDGIYISHSQLITIEGNTVYNTGNYDLKLRKFSAAMVVNETFDGFPQSRNNTITNNIFFAKFPNQIQYYQSNKYNTFGSIGKVDSNYYANPSGESPIIMTNNLLQLNLYSVPEWKVAYPNYDIHSKGSPIKTPVLTPANVDEYLRFEVNKSNAPITIPLSFSYTTVEGKKYNGGSVILQPFTSIILIRDGNVITTPPPPTPTTSQPTASSTAAAINCSGIATTVTVVAKGGSAPYIGTGAFSANAGIGSLKLSFPVNNTSNSTVLLSSIGTLTAGKNYVLKFTTLGTSSSGKLDVIIRKQVSPFTRTYTGKTINFGTSRIDHEIAFKPAVTEASARFDININQGSGTTYIDNIAFFEVSSGGDLISSNLYSNGQFETNTSGLGIWSSNNNQTAQWDNTAKINNTNYYTITDAKGVKATTGIIITQPATALTAASSAPTVKNIGGSTVVLVAASGGKSPYVGTGTFTVTAGAYSYIVTDANGCSYKTSITIAAGSAARVANGTTLVNAATSTTRIQQALKISVSPNPSNNEFSLLVEGGSSEKINIVVVSVDGRTVFQSIGTSNKLYKFGNSFQSGLYIIKVIQGSSVNMLKAIKG